MPNIIDDIKTWMTLNKLKLNDNKTEGMTISSGRKSRSLSFSFQDSLTVGSASVPVSDSVTLDSHVTMKTQVSHQVRSANFELFGISSIHHILSTDAKKTLVSAFVLPRLEFIATLFFLAVLSIS